MQQSINIIYEDDDYLIINKPSLIHSTGKNSIQSNLLKKYPFLKKLPQEGMLQRLDYETSGALAVGKTEEAITKWKEEYKNQKIVKKYLLLVEGSLKKNQIVSGYFGSRYRGSKKVSFSEKAKDRFQFAETHFSTFKSGKGASLLLATTTSGKRHQVRVSASVLGYPLIGDLLYGGKKADHPFFLHAYEILFFGDVVRAEIDKREIESFSKILPDWPMVGPAYSRAD